MSFPHTAFLHPFHPIPTHSLWVPVSLASGFYFLYSFVQMGRWMYFFSYILFFLFFKIYFIFLIFIYLWLCWVFASVRGLSPVVASGGHSSLQCVGPSLSRPRPLWSTGSRRAGSVIVAHGPSCSTPCGIFPDQGLNPCSLHRQADSQPLCHQGSLYPLLSYTKYWFGQKVPSVFK